MTNDDQPAPPDPVRLDPQPRPVDLPEDLGRLIEERTADDLGMDEEPVDAPPEPPPIDPGNFA